MFKNKLLLCSESVIRDATSSLISAINIYEEVIPINYPVFLARMGVLHILEKEDSDPDTIPLHVEIKLDDKILLDNNMDAIFQGKNRTRSIIEMNGIPLEHPGFLIISVTPAGIDKVEYSIKLSPPIEVIKASS